MQAICRGLNKLARAGENPFHDFGKFVRKTCSQRLGIDLAYHDRRGLNLSNKVFVARTKAPLLTPKNKANPTAARKRVR